VDVLGLFVMRSGFGDPKIIAQRGRQLVDKACNKNMLRASLTYFPGGQVLNRNAGIAFFSLKMALRRELAQISVWEFPL
jgi:hypothetical protein